jgi:hypothetical protein
MVGTEWFGLPAVDVGAVGQSTDAGVTFKGSPTSYIPFTLTAVACPTSARCIAVGGHTVATITVLKPPRQPATTGSEGASTT